MTNIAMDAPRRLVLAGREYLGIRVTEPDNGFGYIEITEPKSGKLVGRVVYDGADGSMRLATFGHDLRRETVDALWQLADNALA